jgi:hypothetical protein
MRVEDSGVSVVLDEQQKKYATLEQAKSDLGLSDTVSKTAPTEYANVLGYPTDQEHAFNIHQDDKRGSLLPCYTKTKNSKVIHAAGWYGMLRNGLHAEAFCPKVNTLESYPYIGPYKNQTDLRVAVIAWKRNDLSRHDNTRQVLG